MKKKLIFLELNEINIDFINFYISKGFLHNWKKTINTYGFQLTESEKKYEEIEPWIQWPTIRTGLSYSEHGIFRLGDISCTKFRQHWEILEERGYSVAAVSPINGDNRTLHAPFWIPDPWVNTKVSGSSFVKRFSRALKQAVNDNAQEKLSFGTTLTLLEVLLTKTSVYSWLVYLRHFVGSVQKHHWSKAVILDRMLADIYLKLWKKYKPDFSTLFLNAGAHIQHHYLYSSKAYEGNTKNPLWYVPKGKDPLFDILLVYDSILGELLKLPNTRLMLSVGLTQVPYEDLNYYWRLKNHNKFMRTLNIKFKNVQPRMTRDFLIEFNDRGESLKAEFVLRSVITKSGEKVFGQIDNRGNDIFVTLTYSGEIKGEFNISFVNGDGKLIQHNLTPDVVFVAIKNAHHDSRGFFIDTETKDGSINSTIPIKNIFYKVMDHFDIY